MEEKLKEKLREYGVTRLRGILVAISDPNIAVILVTTIRGFSKKLEVNWNELLARTPLVLGSCPLKKYHRLVLNPFLFSHPTTSPNLDPGGRKPWEIILEDWVNLKK